MAAYISREKRAEGGLKGFSKEGLQLMEDADKLQDLAKENGWSVGYVCEVAESLRKRIEDSPEAVFDIRDDPLKHLRVGEKGLSLTSAE